MRFVMVLLAALAAGGCDETTLYECPTSTDAGANGDAMKKNGWTGNFGSSEALQPQAASAIGWGSLEAASIFGAGRMLVDITRDASDREELEAVPVAITLRGPASGDQVTDQAQIIFCLQWGLGGVTNYALLDAGQVVLVVAESVKVVAIQAMITGAAFPPATPRTPMVGASAAPAVIPPDYAPQFTAAGDVAFAPAVALTIPIPPFARSFEVAATPPASALRFDFDNGGGLPFGGSYNVVAFPSNELPIPGAVNWAANSPILRMTNVGGAAVTSWRVMFKLAL
jgi:hypothetical protein